MSNVHSQLCYLNVIWSTSSDTKITELGRLQNKPIRYIFFKEYKSLSIHTPDLYLSHGNLDIRRLYVYETILLIHKVRHGLIKYNLVLETNSQTHSFGTRRRDDLRTTQARNNYGVHCIVFSGLCMYNGIPNNLKDTPSNELFKKKLKQYLQSQ
jgi:hypothetical protein